LDFPFKQKLDIYLNLKSVNPQLIGKEKERSMLDIWLHALDMCEIKHPILVTFYFAQLFFGATF